jgi:hypothetical protein
LGSFRGGARPRHKIQNSSAIQSHWKPDEFSMTASAKGSHPTDVLRQSQGPQGGRVLVRAPVYRMAVLWVPRRGPGNVPAGKRDLGLIPRPLRIAWCDFYAICHVVGHNGEKTQPGCEKPPWRDRSAATQHHPAPEVGMNMTVARLPTYRQNRPHLRRIRWPSVGGSAASEALETKGLTVLTMLTVSWGSCWCEALIRMTRVPARPSRPKAISMPSVRSDVWARRSRPASARGDLVLLCHKFHLWLLRMRRTQCGHR